jgi:calmodulin
MKDKAIIIEDNNVDRDRTIMSQMHLNRHVDECQEIFAFFDRQRTGRVNLTELGVIIRSIGYNPSELMIRHYRTIYEQQGYEKINFQQFQQILTNFDDEHNDNDELDLIEAFRVFDKLGQGFICRGELVHIMTHLGEKLSNDEAEEMMEDADIYCDGKIRYEQFVRTMTQLN